MSRLRITITLNKEIIESVDSVIDRVKIRNRSHAVEYLLSQVVSPKISQGLILAGGTGVEMRPFTYEIPKALIPVKGRPLIEHTIEFLRDAHIRDIIVATGHLGDKIEQEIGDGRKYGVKITYSHESKTLGTAGALKNASRFLLNKPFLVVNGDVLVKMNLLDFINFHQKDKYQASMALHISEKTKGYGTVWLQGEKILQFVKSDALKRTPLVDAGVYIFNHNIIDEIPERKKVSLEDIFLKLAKEKKLAGFPFDGKWHEISTPETYEKAIKEW